MRNPHDRKGAKTTTTWLTPPRLVQLLGPFDLDPCAAPRQPWKLAKEDYRLPKQDGLALPWSGLVWCNPPYGPSMKPWVDRMVAHNQGVLLVFSHTETRAFQLALRHCSCLFLPAGRLLFYRENGARSSGKQAPNALFAFGSEAAKRLLQLPVMGCFLKRETFTKGPYTLDDMKEEE